MKKEEFKQLKGDLGLNVAQLADELGIAKNTVYRYMRGDLTIPAKIELALEGIKKRVNDMNDDSRIVLKIPFFFDVDEENRIKFLGEFGKKLKSVRENAKKSASEENKSMFSQEGIATVAGLSKPYISDVETGKSKDMTLQTINKLAKAYRVKIEIVFNDQAEPLNEFDKR